MKILFLAIFIISSLAHLSASKLKIKNLRSATKWMLVLSLLGWYIFSAKTVAVFMVLALFFSWLGDILLIPKGTKWFVAGGISFMISHMFFVFVYLPYITFANLPWWAVLLTVTVYVSAVCFVFKGLKKHLPKLLFYPMFLYLLINGTMNAFALFRLITNPCAGSLITYIGAVMFFISDASLFFVRFSKDSKLKTHFVVMLTYIIAEFMIVLGVLI